MSDDENSNGYVCIFTPPDMLRVKTCNKPSLDLDRPDLDQPDLDQPDLDQIVVKAEAVIGGLQEEYEVSIRADAWPRYTGAVGDC